MFLWSSGVFIFGMVLGGLVFLMIFSLLAMARKSEASLERLELARLRTPPGAPLPLKRMPSDHLPVRTRADMHRGRAK
jgi:hypothetical protein